MAAPSEARASSPQDFFLSREIALDDTQLIDLCDLAGKLVVACASDPSMHLESSISLHGITHRNGLVPPELDEAVRGTRFGAIDLLLQEASPGKHQLTVSAFDRDRPDRRITISELDPDMTVMSVSDSHGPRKRAEGREVALGVPVTAITLWLAGQLFQDVVQAKDFVASHGSESLHLAARLLESRAVTKHTIGATGAYLPSGTMLHTEAVTSRRAAEPLAPPKFRYYSAWLTHNYEPDQLPEGVRRLTRRHLVSFSPDCGILDPIFGYGDSTETSARVEIEGAGDAPQLLSRLALASALEAEGTLFDSFRWAATQLASLREHAA